MHSVTLPSEILQWAATHRFEIDYFTYSDLQDQDVKPRKAFAQVLSKTANGLRDSRLVCYSVDDRVGRAELALEVIVSRSLDGEAAYARSVLVLYGVKAFIVQAPGPGQAPANATDFGDGVTCDAGILAGEALDKVTTDPALRSCEAVQFFLRELNSFIYVFANGAELVNMDAAARR